MAERRIKLEANGPPAAPDKRPGWPAKLNPQQKVTVTVKGKGSFEAQTGEPLLNSLERNGINLEAACRSGECSLCRCRVTKGKVFEPSEARVRRSDKLSGHVHSCVTFPMEDIEIAI